MMLVFLLAVITVSTRAVKDENLVIETKNGFVEGKYSDNGEIREFLGIPCNPHHNKHTQQKKKKSLQLKHKTNKKKRTNKRCETTNGIITIYGTRKC